MPRTIHAPPLTAEAYASYGQVISLADANRTNLPEPGVANHSTALRFSRLADVVNLRTLPISEGGATPNLCVFRCQPQQQRPFPLKMLEQHPYSTQLFMPIASPKGADAGNTQRYLVVVAANGPDGQPDYATLKAFVAEKWQGITYFPGVWHHPMVALDVTTDFLCLVWENGIPEQDCVVTALTNPMDVALDMKGGTGQAQPHRDE
ncbi:Allantoicase [Dimargaris xerosporica]|nr:Allantoicase [Dimargaris xerosporica]